jgi:LysR family transcriptional regulator, flagellar master operon regulator
VRKLLEAEELFLVDDSPLITLPVYMVYPLDRQEPYMMTALEGLRELAAGEQREQMLKRAHSG